MLPKHLEAKRDGETVGTKGDIICFSFDGIKNITSGEGGAILSSDKKFIDTVKDIELLGIEKDTQMRFLNQRSWDFDVKEQGFRFHMSNIMAAIGIVQIDRINQFKSKRQNIANTYIKAFKDVEQIKLLDFNYNEILPHIFVIKAQNRDKLREFLISNNIECGININLIICLQNMLKSLLFLLLKVYINIYYLYHVILI